MLGSPDNQALGDEAEAYEELMESVPQPFLVADAPQQHTKRVKLPYGGRRLEVPAPGQGTALLLSLDGKWIKHSVERRGAWLLIENQKHIKGGMSGSPIVSMDGQAIGLVSTGSLNPVLLEALPPRIRLLKDRP